MSKETITRDDIIDGKKYKPRPGTQYEIVKGIIATLREDSFDLVSEVNRIPRVGEDKKDRALHEIALDQAKIILEVPDGWDDWGRASMKVLWRACQDFLTSTLPTEQPQN